MHRLGVRHIQVQTDRLVGVRLGLRQRGPPERRPDGLLLWDAVRGADFGSPERPLRAKARARPDDPAALSFRVRFIRIKISFWAQWQSQMSLSVQDYGKCCAHLRDPSRR